MARHLLRIWRGHLLETPKFSTTCSRQFGRARDRKVALLLPRLGSDEEMPVKELASRGLVLAVLVKTYFDFLDRREPVSDRFVNLGQEGFDFLHRVDNLDNDR